VVKLALIMSEFMKSTLIPEKPILVYPSLAATLGLDEAVMLSVLADCVRFLTPNHNDNYDWYELSSTQVSEALPFWDARDIHRVSTNLREKGVLIVASPPFGSSHTYQFAFNNSATSNGNGTYDSSIPRPSSINSAPNKTYQPAHSPIPAYHTPMPPPPMDLESLGTRAPRDLPGVNKAHFLSKNFIAPNWQPEQTTFDQLAQHAIPREFALQQVPEFVTYWRERGEAHRSWGAKFLQHTLRQWRTFEQKRHSREQETAIHETWRPSADAMDILIRQAQVRREFIEDAIPEFILYWQERGDRLKTWNSKFIQHIRLQWKKFNCAIESSTDPRPIHSNWQPSEDVYDVLRLANIDINFAQSLIPEYVIYWKDTNQLHTSWNTRYLQHVKRHWAKRLKTSTTHSTDANVNRSTRDISLEEQLTDRSWAN